MAEAAKPEEPAREPDLPAEVDPRMERMQRLMNASFPPSTGSATATSTAMQTQSPDQRRQQQAEYGR